MALLVVFSVILFTSTQAEIDLTPFANFTPEVKDTVGHCNLIEGIKVAEDKSKYEGRWYTAYMGMTKSKMSNVKCLVWDTFFDQYGQFHNFLSIQENGTVKVLHDVGTPMDEKKGIYQFYFDAATTTSFLINTFFYIDDEMWVWWEEECIINKNIKRQMATVAFRSLKDVEKNERKLNKIYKKLKAMGGETDKFRMSHEDCQYPDKMQNPFNFAKSKPDQNN